MLLHAKILRWGNSLGIRLSKPEADKEGLRAGDEVLLELKAHNGSTIDMSGFKPAHLGGDLREHHDEVEWA